MEVPQEKEMPQPVSENDSNVKEENLEASQPIVDGKTSAENSEYDSAGSYSDEEEQQPVKARSRASGLDSQSDTEGSVILEREEGDGQESVPIKKVDDDEDKKNPQYIPKRGTFYEHDDRTADDVETTETPEAEKGDKDGKKKVWQDKKEKWNHDRFNDNEQAPKSRAELIAIYGYDIRNEEGPPRARRRRRYGRGPNKYTRNWEDEDAYNKAPPVINRVKKPVSSKNSNREEFPPLGGRNQSLSPDNSQNDSYVGEEELENSYRGSSERIEPNKENTMTNPPPRHPVNNGTSTPSNNVQEPSATRSNQHQQQQSRVGSGRVPKPKKEIKDSDYRGFTTKTRQQRNMKTDQQKILPPRNHNKNEDFIQSQNFTNKNNVQDVEQEMGKLNIQDGVYKGGKNHSNRQGSVPPRLQPEQKGSKRYSSMRQRSLPETNTPPAPNYQHSFYPNDYNSQAPPPANPGPIMRQTTAQLPPQLPPMPQQVPPMPQQVPPVTAAPLLQAQFPPTFPQPPPAFLQPAVAPPPLFPPQQPQIIPYVQGQPQFPPNFQGYQQQFNPVTPPTELYQPQGGITYYCTDQQVVQRAVPQKRPKAAIPIVAPTDLNKEKDQKENENIKLQQDATTVNVSETFTQEMVDVQE